MNHSFLAELFFLASTGEDQDEISTDSLPSTASYILDIVQEILSPSLTEQNL